MIIPKQSTDSPYLMRIITLLNAYLLPRIDETVNKIAQYSLYSTIDLRSVYHHVLIKPEDKPYKAFEAAGELYQFTRIPFGVSNGVAYFQRKIDEFISEEELNGTLPTWIMSLYVVGRKWSMIII